MTSYANSMYATNQADCSHESPDLGKVLRGRSLSPVFTCVLPPLSNSEDGAWYFSETLLHTRQTTWYIINQSITRFSTSVKTPDINILLWVGVQLETSSQIRKEPCINKINIYFLFFYFLIFVYRNILG